MTKKLYAIKVCYDVMVAVGSEDPMKIAVESISDIVKYEKPYYDNMGLVHSINPKDDWYTKIPYGDTKDMKAPYYTTKATQEREDIVAKVRGSLSEDEWNILKTQLIGEGK